MLLHILHICTYIHNGHLFERTFLPLMVSFPSGAGHLFGDSLVFYILGGTAFALTARCIVRVCCGRLYIANDMLCNGWSRLAVPCTRFLSLSLFSLCKFNIILIRKANSLVSCSTQIHSLHSENHTGLSMKRMKRTAAKSICTTQILAGRIGGQYCALHSQLWFAVLVP